MSTVLVWILIMHSWDGGMIKVENIASWEDCERMRQRVTHSGSLRRNGDTTVLGTCTQVGILVPNQATTPITVNVPQQPAPVVNNRVNNRVIIRKNP